MVSRVKMGRKARFEWVGEPEALENRRLRYRRALVDGQELSDGDTVEVNWHTGTEFAIVLSMFAIQGRRQRFFELLWFDKRRGAEPQELLITATYSPEPVESFRRKVNVVSKREFDALPKPKRSRRGAAAEPSDYFCRHGLETQSRVVTKELDWAYTYTEDDRREPKEFHARIDEIIRKHAVAEKPALSKRLAQKIVYDMVEDELAMSSGGEEDSASDDDSGAGSEGSYAPVPPTPKRRGRGTRAPAAATPRKRRRTAVSDSSDDDDDMADFIDDEDDADYGKKKAPRTPRKNKKVGSVAGTPRTPRTPKRFTTVTTPGSRSYRVRAPLEVTPLPSRVFEKDGTLLSPHQLARQRLHVAEVPASLPCREDEFGAIYDQVESAIQEGESSLIYVSGTPGTGKTATVREVVKTLQQRVADGDVFPFDFVEINGMKMPDPNQAYSRLWECLTGQRVTPSHALGLLQKEFTRRNPLAQACVVLMDELDQLTTTRQEVMYNFFQWPNMPRTKLIVVAVANTMDLPERTLAHKVSSRLGLTRVAFAAYTRDQLVTIIRSRLETVAGVEVEDAAITYACMRVSRVSGDARRALDICRRAFELAEPEFTMTPRKNHALAGTGKVTLAVMRQAFEQMTSSPMQRSLKGLSLCAKLLLRAVVACTTRSGLTETNLGDVIEDCMRMCQVNSHPGLQKLAVLPAGTDTATAAVNGRSASASARQTPRKGLSGPGRDLTREVLAQPVATLKVVQQLAEAAVVFLERAPSLRHCRLRLKVPESELLAAWAEDEEMQGVS